MGLFLDLNETLAIVSGKVQLPVTSLVINDGRAKLCPSEKTDRHRVHSLHHEVAARARQQVLVEPVWGDSISGRMTQNEL